MVENRKLVFEEHSGDFADHLEPDELKWAYGLDPHPSILHDPRDTHLFCRDKEGSLLGVLTFQRRAWVEWEWICINPSHRDQKIASSLTNVFLNKFPNQTISCTIICAGHDRTKIERMLRKHDFENDPPGSDNWIRDLK